MPDNLFLKKSAAFSFIMDWMVDILQERYFTVTNARRVNKGEINWEGGIPKFTFVTTNVQNICSSIQM